MNNTDTPKTNAWAHWNKDGDIELVYASISRSIERELAAEIANRKKCCLDGNAISDELFDTQQKLKKAETEAEFYKETPKQTQTCQMTKPHTEDEWDEDEPVR